MNLYLLRHGEAGKRVDDTPEGDANRSLTEEGRRRVERGVRGLRAVDAAFDAILSSPLLRALQTAQIVADAFRAQSVLETTPHLAPGGDPDKLLDQVAGGGGLHKGVLLVGHEPDLGQLASRLLFGEAASCLRLKKGGLIKLAVSLPYSSRCAELRWLLTPRQLVRLGKG
jgi:phosphohistidine phosphatase